MKRTLFMQTGKFWLWTRLFPSWLVSELLNSCIEKNTVTSVCETVRQILLTQVFVALKTLASETFQEQLNVVYWSFAIAGVHWHFIYVFIWSTCYIHCSCKSHSEAQNNIQHQCTSSMEKHHYVTFNCRLHVVAFPLWNFTIFRRAYNALHIL